MNLRKAIFDEAKHLYVCPQTKLVVPSVTQLRDMYGFGQNYDFVESETMEVAGHLGTELDNAISLIEQGYEIESMDDRVKPCVDGYLELKEKLKWKVESVHNGGLGPAIADVNGAPVGFCFDLKGWIDGEAAMVEIKRTSTVAPGVGFQTAFYNLCDHPHGELRMRAVFQLLPGKFRLWTSKEKDSKIFNRQDYDACRSTLFLYWYAKNRGLNGDSNH